MNKADRKKLIVGIVVVLAAIIVVVSFGADGITGSTVIKNVPCYEDIDCDDRREGTEDFCKNPGTEFSLCVNKLK